MVLLHKSYEGSPYNKVLEPLIQDSLKQVVANYRAEDAVKQREAVRVKAVELVKGSLVELAKAKTGEKNVRPLAKAE